jgi:hypothetical protein
MGNHCSTSGQAALMALMAEVRQNLRLLFTARQQAQARQRAGLQRQLLFGLELLWKIEEQVLLPALHEAAAARPPDAVCRATHELELMRDLALLAAKTGSHNREITLAVLEGLALLHFAGGASLLAEAPRDAVDWTALDREVRELLRRWRGEVLAHGEIEDEDGDPVGEPPRSAPSHLSTRPSRSNHGPRHARHRA